MPYRPTQTIRPLRSTGSVVMLHLLPERSNPLHSAELSFTQHPFVYVKTEVISQDVLSISQEQVHKHLGAHALL